MINLSLDKLRLTAQIRNISDYENKSERDLIKALSEPEPKTERNTKTRNKTKANIKTRNKTKNKHQNQNQNQK